MKTAINTARKACAKFATVLMILTSAGCLSASDAPTDPTDPDPIVPSTSAPKPRTLTSYGDCDGLVAELKTQAISEMEATLDGYYQCYDKPSYDDGGDGDTVTMSSEPASSPSSDGTAVSSDSSGSSASEESTVSFTDTNVQENGVDEADTVKSDGERLFVAASGGIDVFRIWPLSDFGKIATYDFESAAGLYLTGDKLIVLQNEYDAGNGSSVKVTTLDVSDAERPVTVSEKNVGGTLVSSRLTGGVLHVAVSAWLSYGIDYPEWNSADYGIACGGGTAAAGAQARLDKEIADAKAKLRAEIEAATLSDWLGGDIDVSASCDNLLSDGNESLSLMGLASLDTDGGEELVTYVKGSAMEVYASREAVYLAANRTSDAWTLEFDAGNENSLDIHRFAIGGTGELHSYAGSGAVSGHVLDQFSMSEHDGTLRVATTVGQVSRDGSRQVYSNVFILDATSPELALLGSVTDIAPGETIYAARFIGTKGYVVTFEKVDPLFVIDLADPANPRITGELKIPGYSTYLHPLDDGTLIGLGKDAEDAGSFSWFQGLKLGVYGVEDTAAPSVIEELIIGSRGSDSAALYDHHGFNFDAKTGVLALPLSLYEGGSGGSDYGTYSYSGVHFYALSADGGIETIAEVPTSLSESSTSWYSYSDQPQRTVMIGDAESRGAYVIGTDTVQLIDMSGGYEITGSEDLSRSSSYECGYCYAL